LSPVTRSNHPIGEPRNVQRTVLLGSSRFFSVLLTVLLT